MRTRSKKRLAFGAGLLAAVVGGASYLQANQEAVVPASKFHTTTVDVGDITQTVTATGTINPVALINVGSQMSGTVAELNADFNDHVRKGQVLLKLDPTIFNAGVRKSQAGLASAAASLRLAQATYERNERLVAQNYLSALVLDQARRELDVARANFELAKAELAHAQADLDNSVIRAPIDGVVIKRTIELGQTVAAAFTTPNLFQIAQDLTKMQIDTNVSEADVGALKDRQAARFVVDAYPDKEFDATMRQFRLAATVAQNVVTYNVVLDVANRDELLKPGMTAQVRLVVGNRQHVLRIPTAALRFRLSDEELEKEARLQKERGGGSPAVAAPAASGDDVAFLNQGERARSFKIYKLDARNQAVPVDVQIGLSNFRYTEVRSGAIKPGDKVVVRALTPGAPGLL
ncbi:efflux RND transporter periplasmic adaptor subunit [Duganella violaceipulchra]|uniref:Efflux RND transporter periplasmic adaptor subunit n=1 Tax=Duganella violaceipulchra TaxID=2849652 RepID=A0AA41H6A9_9BURK|nr:efflux RND transporter periplasmic adaptor subunit [Duganella violaceicalia]MBV6322702.1 efflux RND transporter periplasmic adaptor subunit [Duganella violaceicalia]MCP2010916.1 HlyD family secretion protein [Duganella violaceicalia]